MTKPVELTKGDRFVKAYKPTTITRLKSQGWTVVPAAEPTSGSAPRTTVERPAGKKDTNEK